MGVRATARFHWEAQALMLEGDWDLQDSRVMVAPRPIAQNRLEPIVRLVARSLWHE
jgi:hypothetical protein